MLVCVLAHAGCGTDKPAEPAPRTEVQLLPFSLSDAGQRALVPTFQGALESGILTRDVVVKPRFLGTPSDSARTAIRTETEDGGFLVAQFDPAVFTRQPPTILAADLSFFLFQDVTVERPEREGIGAIPSAPLSEQRAALGRPPDSDPELKRAVEDLLQTVSGLGIDTRALNGAFGEALFYDEIAFPCGLPGGTREGASLPWGMSAIFNLMQWDDDWNIIWWDGRSHVVFASARVTNLKNREFFRTDGTPTEAAGTALHELIHVVIARTGCGPDDDTDQVVGGLEAALTQKIAIEKQRQTSGGPTHAAVGAYSNSIQDVLGLGGAGCLTELGIVYAGNVEVDAPSQININATGTISILVRGTGGAPMSGADVAVSIGENQQVLRTGASGALEVSFTAPSTTEENLTVLVRAGGRRFETVIAVVDNTVRGACCLPDLDCVLLSRQNCDAQGGNHLGSGTSCDSLSCGDLGACCGDDGQCLVLHRGGCDLLRYAFLGVGVPCEPDPCPDISGACCTGTFCNVTTRIECQDSGGERWLPGLTCDPNPCVDRGACCADDGSCSITTRQECAALNRFYIGDLTVCEPSPCPRPGACCTTGAVCTVVLELRCNADFLGDGTVCEPNPCPGPGACCSASATCSITLPAACDGTYLGLGTTCEPNPCPQTGACCAASGSCALTLAAECDGTFQGPGTGCDPNNCPQPPTGACCQPAGTCLVTSQTGCSQAGGEFLGVDTGCDPNPCPIRGACCSDGVFCEVRTAAQCASTVGAYQGDGTTCDPNPCPDETAACCFNDGHCEMLAQSACILSDGVFAADSCDPEPCVFGACCFKGVICDVIPRFRCGVTEADVFHGAGSTCDPSPCRSACCAFDGTCTTTLQSECTGTWIENEFCVDLPCATGACCLLNLPCIVLAPAGCAAVAGVYLGNGTDCDPDPCGGAPIGACCYSLSSCLEMTAAECAVQEGTWFGEGSDCTPVPCQIGCCLLDGTCVVTSGIECVADGGLVAYYTCTPYPCPNSYGACCAVGVCSITTPQSCAGHGIYYGDGIACRPGICDAPPSGACCFPIGDCQITTATACAGAFQGVETTCSPGLCIPAGACCFGENCVTYTQSECTGAGGDYIGNGAPCVPNPCPDILGACCLFDTTCFLASERQCGQVGGTFLGTQTLCQPQNPCVVQGACCADGGACSLTLPQNCPGVFQGTGSTCDPNPCGAAGREGTR